MLRLAFLGGLPTMNSSLHNFLAQFTHSIQRSISKREERQSLSHESNFYAMEVAQSVKYLFHMHEGLSLTLRTHRRRGKKRSAGMIQC